MLATAKIHILKQFTTKCSFVHRSFWLCLLLQRYTFWSNSQPLPGDRTRYVDCACYCKDTHFEAIHNLPPSASITFLLCLLLQRYTFWSNSQLEWPRHYLTTNCACYCKDTHFEAIHNIYGKAHKASHIVLATAKIHILKQFTTKRLTMPLMMLLCLLLQRYTFWSNSQLTLLKGSYILYCACYCKDTHFEAIHNVAPAIAAGGSIVLATAKIHILKQFTTKLTKQQLPGDCACYCKDTHFEAIHNIKSIPTSGLEIVLATAKIHILKQFTTSHEGSSSRMILCLLLQRYTFWSNSQPKLCCPRLVFNCACYCKDTHFEAIHNKKADGMNRNLLCLLLQRYTFWSNSQRKTNRWLFPSHCACYCKDTHFEAIHNTTSSTTKLTYIVLATAKIHILKQFTTSPCCGTSWSRLCLLLQRYTFWSNSQHKAIIKFTKVIVLATAKIHILKQFTTRLWIFTIRILLCLLLQRYTFWSNSQHKGFSYLTRVNCACYCKDTHFEAIHNLIHVLLVKMIIVLATAKIHILKQFTTNPDKIQNSVRLCLLLQRYTFWSNSQRYRNVIVLKKIVLATAKIHILKQFTTRKRTEWIEIYCACYCKDTHFEAIHNGRQIGDYSLHIVLATAKIHILKQFTTQQAVQQSSPTLCLLLQRYTFWSNSQQVRAVEPHGADCACYCKDTHFEAIHNIKRSSNSQRSLCLLLQRYTFWSNSQRDFESSQSEFYCACYCKDTHFEAIHNIKVLAISRELIVLATAKIHILKQFTTSSTYY